MKLPATAVRPLLAALGLLAAAAAVADGDTVTEPETGKTFPVTRDFGGASHTLIGVGAFEAFGAIDVYGAGFYLETDAARRSWQRFLAGQGASFVENGQVNWPALKDSNQLYQWISGASFGRAFWSKVVRSATAEQIVELHQDVLRSLIDDYETARLVSPLKDFEAATAQDIEAGQEMMIWSRGSTIWVKSGSRPVVEIPDAASLIRPLWKMWFGSRPLQVPLRRAFVGRIETLGGPAPAE